MSHSLKAHVWFKRRLDSPRFDKIEHLGRRDWVHHFHLRSLEDLDDEVRGWLCEAYVVGRQEWPVQDSGFGAS